MANNSQAVIPDNIIHVVGDIPGGKIQDNGGLGKDGEGALYVKTDGETIDINSDGELEVIGGGGHEYTAGTGIDITNDEISVDTSVVATQTDLEGYTPTASLANVALSGDYADLTNTPNLALKEDVANKAQTVDATSTTDYPSSAGVAQYVSSAVATATATFLGNFTLTELGLTYPATEQQITAALASHTWPAGTTVDKNDYVYVEIQNPQTTGVDDSVQRYKYNGTAWAYEYTLNNSSFTSGEVDALESGINATKVGNYDAHIADTTIHVTSSDKSTWNGKQDAISDLETIRTGAGLGATAVQPGDLATVASTGDYEDLLNKPTIPSGAQLLPSATSADEGKFLLVDANGLPEWSDLSEGSSYSIARGSVVFTPGQYYTDGVVTLSNIRSNGIDYAYNHDGWVLEADHTYVIAFNIVASVGYAEPGNITGRVWLDGFQETDQVWKFSLDTSATHDESLVGSAIVCPQSTGEVHLNIRFDSNQLAHVPTASVNKAEVADVTARVNGAGGATYSAGTGLNLTGTTFSVDTTTIATKSDLSAYATTSAMETALAGKQNALTAGDGIAIDANNEISVAVDNSTITVNASGEIQANIPAPVQENFIAVYGTTTFHEIYSAYNNGKAVFLKYPETVSIGTSGQLIPVSDILESNSPEYSYAYFTVTPRGANAGNYNRCLWTTYRVTGTNVWDSISNAALPYVDTAGKVLTSTETGGVRFSDPTVNTHTIVVDDSNPYGLAPKTMRVRFEAANYDPTSDLSSSDFYCRQVTSSPNVWDITFKNSLVFDNRISYDAAGGFHVVDFNVYGCTSIRHLFQDASGLLSLTILNAEGVEDMSEICPFCSHLVSVSISKPSSVRTMQGSFYYCTSLQTADISGLSNIENMYDTFCNTGLTSFPDWSNETFSRLTNVSEIFSQSRNIQSGIQDMYTKLSGIPTITSHGEAFYECGSNGPAASELYNIPSSWGGRA